MPIRLCQKCGLKVLIDESQAGTNPFYCQRCTTAMKGQENASAVAPSIKNPTPSPVAMANRSDPAAPSVGAAKAATVRVLCPYCKASFNGRVPQKPARGSCPVCQKELILLPNGDIKPSAGFDLGSWSGGDGPPGKSPEPAASPEPAIAPPKESGTRLLVKKYAAESQPARPAAKKSDALATPSPVTAPAETDTADDTNPLPGWLDDSTQGGGGAESSPAVEPQPETDVDIDVVEPPPKEEVPEDLVEPEPPPPPPPARARSPIAAKMPSLSPGRPPESLDIPAEPEVDLLPPDPPVRKPTGRIPKQPPAPVAVSSGGEETGGGKVFLAFFLTILPLAACAGLLANRDKLNNNDIVKKVGTRFTAGFGKLHLKLFPPPPPAPAPKIEEKKAVVEPPKEEPPKPDPEQQKKDELAITKLYESILREQRDLKQSLVAASPEQKAKLDQVAKDLDSKRAKLTSMRDIYRKMYGKDYDPAKD